MNTNELDNIVFTIFQTYKGCTSGELFQTLLDETSHDSSIHLEEEEMIDAKPIYEEKSTSLIFASKLRQSIQTKISFNEMDHQIKVFFHKRNQIHFY